MAQVMTEAMIQIGEYRLSFSTQTGLLTSLRRGGGPEALHPEAGGPLPLAAALAYQPLDAEPQYRSHQIENGRLSIEIQLGPLCLTDQYAAANGFIERRMRVQNCTDHELQLTGLRIGLRGVAIDEPVDCRFEAPGNAYRPRLPLAEISSLPMPATIYPGHRPAVATSQAAPGADYVWGRALGDAPDIGHGLLCVHNSEQWWSFMTWYFSRVEAGKPWVSGDGTYAALGFDLFLSGWLAPGASLESGSQYLALVAGDLDAAYASYRGSLTRSGILPPIYGEADRAADWVGVYEVHPGQFGGFHGLRKELGRLQKMGIDTLYLLPIYKHRNKKGQPWDGNWESIGSPYAILDFEELEPSLGGPEAFRDMVATAHDLGMRVLVDLVLQGSGLEAPYVQQHPEWYERDEQGSMIHSHGWGDTWSFDWANPDYQRFVIDYALKMIKDFDIDGFRTDAPHGKEPNWDRSVPYHASVTNLGTVKLLETLRREMQALKPEATMLCELYGPLWVHSHETATDYHPFAMGYGLAEGKLTPWEFNEYLRDYWAVLPPGAGRIAFTETHDTRGGPAYAWRGSALSQALLGIFVMTGFIPMVWSGQEMPQIDFMQGLLMARRRNPVLRRGAHLFNAVTVDDLNHYRARGEDRPARWLYTHLRHDGENVVLGVASLYPEQVTFRLGLPLDELPIDPAKKYQLRDLISFEVWHEYGCEAWTGAELASFTLTPKMYTPYLFRIEEVE